MLTSKQRAHLRSLSNGAPVICQIGKEGITENLIKQLDEALLARELVKTRVLENAPCFAKEALFELSEILHSEQVCSIGKTFVLYRQARDIKKRVIEL